MDQRPVVEVREDLDHPDRRYVDLYRRMGERPDLTYWLELAGQKPGAIPRVLELGCGVGGLARPLAARGLHVWAVDSDHLMLEELERLGRPRNLEVVEERIESLRLPLSFDLVVLSSHIVNVNDYTRRLALYRTAVGHLSPGGILALEVDDPDWFSSGRSLDVGPIRIECERFDPESGGWVGRILYFFEDVVYLQRVVNHRVLTAGQLQQELDQFGVRQAGGPVRLNQTDLVLTFSFPLPVRGVAGRGPLTDMEGLTT